jgi:hypothetical protein
MTIMTMSKKLSGILNFQLNVKTLGGRVLRRPTLRRKIEWWTNVLTKSKMLSGRLSFIKNTACIHGFTR